jgi:hypothetical protein
VSCTIVSSDLKIVFQDGRGKSKMCFSNPNRRKIKKITVDNCIIKDGKRCDFLLIDHNNIEHFIELKGKKVEYASTQIIETINKISQDVNALKYSFIVSTSCPLITSEIQILKIKFKKKYNCILHIKNTFCEHHIK